MHGFHAVLRGEPVRANVAGVEGKWTEDGDRQHGDDETDHVQNRTGFHL